MDDLAVAGEIGRLDQFVVPVDRDLLARLVDQRLDECIEVARVKRRSARRDTAGHIEIADDLDAVYLGDLAGPGALDVAAALDRQIDQHRARTHGGDHRRRHQAWRRPAGNERRGDDDVLLPVSYTHLTLPTIY